MLKFLQTNKLTLKHAKNAGKIMLDKRSIRSGVHELVFQRDRHHFNSNSSTGSINRFSNSQTPFGLDSTPLI